MSNEEDLCYLDGEDLTHGRCKHSCGGVLRATWTADRSILLSITCDSCASFVRFNASGEFIDSTGDVLDLAHKIHVQEGNA